MKFGYTKAKGVIFGFLPAIFIWGFMGRKTSTIPKATVARILLKAGAKRVSQDAVDAFTDILTDISIRISKRASDIAKHSGRKTVHEGDVKLAAK